MLIFLQGVRVVARGGLKKNFFFEVSNKNLVRFSEKLENIEVDIAIRGWIICVIVTVIVIVLVDVIVRITSIRSFSSLGTEAAMFGANVLK